MRPAMSSSVRIARVLALLAAAPAARASGGHSFLGDDGAILTARWELATPIGDMRNLVSSVSPAGVSGDVRFALGNSSFSLGVGASWHHFHGGTPRYDIHATSPMTVFHGYLSRSTVQPYLGVGAGGVHTKTTGGPGALDVSNWGFCADPQIGLLVTLADELALDVRVHYEWTTVNAAGAKNYQWVGLGVGFGFY